VGGLTWRLACLPIRKVVVVVVGGLGMYVGRKGSLRCWKLEKYLDAAAAQVRLSRDAGAAETSRRKRAAASN